jgi:Transmembrane domain of unknown function (DUF3566)
VSVSSSEQAYRSGSGPQITGRPSGASGDGGSPSFSASAPTTVTPPAGRPGPGASPGGNGTGNGRPPAGPMTRPPAGYSEAPRAAGPATGGTPIAGPRKVRLTVARVDPWSVLKLSFLLSVALGIVFVTASVVLWSVLDAMGVFSSINNELRSIGSANNRFDINQWVGLGRVVSLTTVIAVVNVLIIMALSTLGAVLYNLASSLVGGLQVTLSDD